MSRSGFGDRCKKDTGSYCTSVGYNQTCVNNVLYYWESQCCYPKEYKSLTSTKFRLCSSSKNERNMDVKPHSHRSKAETTTKKILSCLSCIFLACSLIFFAFAWCESAIYGVFTLCVSVRYAWILSVHNENIESATKKVLHFWKSVI